MIFPAVAAARPASPNVIAMTSAVWRAMCMLDENMESGGDAYPSWCVLETGSLETRWSTTTGVEVATFGDAKFSPQKISSPKIYS